MNRLALSTLLLLTAAPALAQTVTGPQVSQPTMTQNQSQAQQNMAQQPGNARQSGTGQAQDQQITQPSVTQNQSQQEQNQNQQSGARGNLGVR